MAEREKKQDNGHTLREIAGVVLLYVGAAVRAVAKKVKSSGKNMKKKDNKKKPSRYALGVFFAATVIYLETVFRMTTVGGVFSVSFLYVLLFSIAYGGIGYILGTLFPKRKINRVISGVLLGATSALFIVQFLIYKQFKQFYDINTMTGGAADALTSYFKELLALLFLQGGIFVVALLAVPFVVYLVWGKKRLPAVVLPLGSKAVTLAASVLAFLLALAMVLGSKLYEPVYRTQYNFQSAVGNFGLLTGLRLDLKHHTADPDYSFEVPEQTTTQPEESTVQTDPIETTVPVVVYGDNVLDIDFEALNASASSKEKKLNDYVSTLTPSKQNEYTGLFKGKNLIFITAEAFSAEVIDETLTPTLYRLATKGIQFTDYYQPASAGTTGGEYQNVFGMLPMDGGQSFKNTVKHLNYYTMGNQLDRLGYYGKAFHNNSYTYYSRNKTHNNIGYSDGFMGYGNGMEEFVKKAWPQSDFEMISGTLPTYIDKQPFNIYYMSVSGHSNYTRSGNSQTKRHWERVAHLECSDTIKGYLAANLDLEDAMAHLVSELEAKGIADDTVICISTDHFPYGLDSDAKLGNMPYLSELYGFNVENYIQRDHSRLILWCGSLEESEPIVVSSPTFSLDILPTLSNLFGTEFDSRLMPGRDVFSDAQALVFNTNYDWKTDLGTYYSSKGTFVPVSEDTVIPEGYVDRMKSVVRNKITYCSGVLDTDYFRHIFG